MNVLRRLIETVDGGTTCVLATVVQVHGSAPRRQGARLLLSANGTREGTVGGGEVEAEVLASARTMLTGGPNARTLEMATNCGGTVTVMLEKFGPHRRLLIIGAGHVGAALAIAGARAGYRVTVASPTVAEAGIVDMRPAAQKRLYYLQPKPFQELDRWLDTFRPTWEARLDTLEAFLQEMQGKAKKPGSPEVRRSKT